MKFIPDLSPDAFKAILTSNPEYSDEESLFRKTYEELYDLVETEIFSYDGCYKQINYPSKGGVTAYFSRNITEEDLAVVQAFLVE